VESILQSPAKGGEKIVATKLQAFIGFPSEEVSDGLWYCERLQLWWKDGKVYDRLSASHNGLIGPGAELKKIAKEHRGG
jgi:hypothetical protein